MFDIKFDDLTDAQLCSVNRVFKRCRDLSFFKYKERYELLKTLSNIFPDGFIEWLDEHDDNAKIDSLICFKGIALTSEMAERFYLENLVV